MDFFQNSSIKRVLFVVAHPDDEVLGAGGTIKRLTESGKNVSLLVFTDGVSSRYKNISSSEQADEYEAKKFSRKKALLAASKFLGIRNVELLDFPDNELDKFSTLLLAKEIEKAIDEFRPNLIFTHSVNDLNQDHRAVSYATDIASRPIINLERSPSAKLYALLKFRVISASEYNFYNEFKPNLFLDVQNYLDIKKQALSLYSDELCQIPHPRSYEGLEITANFIGLKVGLNSCEEFEITWLCM